MDERLRICAARAPWPAAELTPRKGEHVQNYEAENSFRRKLSSAVHKSK